MILFLIVGAVFVVKMVDVFKRNTVLINSQRTIGTTTLEADISTVQDNPELQPTMLAFKANSLFYSMSNRYTTSKNSEVLQMETCTTKHFEKVPKHNFFF